MPTTTRTPAERKARQLAKHLRGEYEEVWTGRRGQDIVLIKTLLSSPGCGFLKSELVRIRLVEVDLDACRIRITQGRRGSYNQNLWIDHLITGAAYLPR